jgi:hypothetical protein
LKPPLDCTREQMVFALGVLDEVLGAIEESGRY